MFALAPPARARAVAREVLACRPMGLLDRLRGRPEDRFAREVLAAVRARGVEAWYDRDEFVVGYRQAPGDSQGLLYLRNTFLESRGEAARERAERIAKLVNNAMVEEGLPGWAEVVALLRPVLRGVTFHIGAPDGAPPLLSRPGLPFLNELVVVDRPTTMAYVTTDQVRTWGVRPDEVFAAARANLARLAGQALEGFAGPDGPAMLRFLDSGDEYIIGRLLLNGWLARLADHVGGRPVAFAPDTQTLVVVRDDPALLAEVLPQIEEEYTEAPRSLTPAAYTVDASGAVVPYAAVEPVELANLVHRAESILAQAEYAAQKDWLDASHEKHSIDVYVAQLMMFRRPDGSVFTATTWTDGAEALLPRADVVGFATHDGSQEPFFVPWPVVEAETGLAPDVGTAPPRYSVTAWPAEPVLSRLRAAAI